MKKITLIMLIVFSLAANIYAVNSRFSLTDDGGIEWDLSTYNAVPHKDHMAMSGRTVDMILEWEIDRDYAFSAVHLVRWPMLRTIPDDTHASLSRKLSTKKEPEVLINDNPLSKGKVQKIKIHGFLEIINNHDEGVTSVRTIFPSVSSPAVIDLITLTNKNKSSIKVVIPRWREVEKPDPEKGFFGSYLVEEFLIGETDLLLAPGESFTYATIRSARMENDNPYYGDPEAEFAARKRFISNLENSLILETPDPVLNRLFAFSKLRGAESIFSTRGGLMHGPGGYNKYLAALWANDQAEYINPFFPFLGDAAGNESALNCFRHYARYTNPEYKRIPSSIIAEGRGFWNGAGDRGDMAMLAYGASRFALASGNRQWSEELWPLIEWCLEYCDRKKNEDGVISSDSDELEGRFPAGEANLCTSSLYYDALISSAYLADELEKGSELTRKYQLQTEELKFAIKYYFEDEVEGFPTYRYYDGNDILRSWICIPLTVDIKDRLDGTVDALFSPRLWTKDGLLTQAGTKTVWDRSTLYALRGVIYCGVADIGYEKLHSYSEWRLLGEHVPYVIEAYPESNQSHLSAESGLYCRIFTEGFFGIRPMGLHKFSCTPQMPKEWNRMTLKKVKAFGMTWDIEVKRKAKDYLVIIKDSSGKKIYKKYLPAGDTHIIDFE